MLDVKNYKSNYLSSNIDNLFFDTIIHDLKNPLIAQISSLNLLKKGAFGKLNDNQQEIIDEIIKSSEYMKEILYNVLKQGRINNGTLKLNNKNFDVEQLVRTIIKSFEHFALEKNIKIHLAVNIKNKNFCGDEIQFRRVFENLINNAITYSFENTCVKIQLFEENDILIFSIENEGYSIEENIKKFIFEKFVKGKESSGAGLGLFFCKKIIEAYNGEIEVLTNEKENVFLFKIPYQQLSLSQEITF